MGNFEKLSVVVIVVIIVMILAVAVVEWSNGPSEAQPGTEPGVEKASEPQTPVEPPRTEVKPLKSTTPKIVTPKIGGKEEKPPSTSDLIKWQPWSDGPEPTVDEKKGEGAKSEKPDVPPTPAPAPAPTSTDIPETTHVVAEGETLSDIAKKHWGKASLWPLIADANPGMRPESLRKGESIKIPARKNVVAPAPGAGAGASPGVLASGGAGKPVPGKEYVVQANDTWERIAQAAYNTSARWPEIYVKNLDRVANMKDLSKGKTIMIPK